MSLITPNKSHTVPSSGHKYTYIHHAPRNPRTPTLLLLHGFPSTSYDWRPQINHFRTQGYGILAPDLLGYGGSSKPSDVSSYIGTVMSSDIISILDHEGISETIVCVSHDWGTYLGSQLAIYYPERFWKYVFVSVPFHVPGKIADLGKLNEATKKMFGFEMYGYWLFLTEEGAGRVIGEHWESFFSIAYASNPEEWKSSFAAIDGLRNFITSDSITPLASYISAEDKAHHHAVFGDDYSACVNWYKRGIDSLGAREEQKLLKEGKIKAGIERETLMIAGTRDVVCLADHAEATMKRCVSKGKLKMVHLDAGHWVNLERASEFNRALQEFCEGGVDSVKSKASL